MQGLVYLLCVCVLYVNARSYKDVPDVFTYEKVKYDDVRCGVCKASIEEVNKKILKVNPKIQMGLGGYRVDEKGDLVQKKVPYARSEVHVVEVLDTVCQNMESFVRGKVKKSGKTIVFSLTTDEGTMNPLLGHVDIVQDGDMHKSVQFYCEGIMDEYEEEIIKMYAENEENPKKRLCIDVSGLCPPGDEVEEDYYLTDIDTEAEFEDSPWDDEKKQQGTEKEMEGNLEEYDDLDYKDEL